MFFLLMAVSAVQAQPVAAGANALAISDELLVKIGSGVGGVGALASSQRASLARAAHASVGSQVVKDYSRIGWQRVRLPKGTSVSQALIRYKRR